MADTASRRRVLQTDGARLTLALVMVIALGLAALPRVEQFFLTRAGTQGMATLRLSVEGLRGALQRFEPLPGLIGERPVLAELLADPQDASLQAEVNEELRLTADALGASDVYLLDAQGLTIAASNYLKERSFLGRQFAFRPYFTQAIAGGLGRYFALGTTSLERGYFYAAPVMDDGAITGVLTLKFTVDAFEDAWRGGTSDIIVSDLNDIVFMSSRPQWHFRTLSDLEPGVLAEIAETQQYPIEELVPLRNTRAPISDTLDLIGIEDEGTRQDFITASTAA
jgi:two-component system C4-dicarboxylate transport sensor histidine kinase DctB